MRHRFSAALCALLLLTGCSLLGSKKPASGSGTLVYGSLNALRITMTIVQAPFEQFFRPAPNLGLFATLFLSESGFLPVTASLNGIQSEVRIHAITHIGSEDQTYALLQEFGSVLKVDIPDLLNRSTNRADTLNEYLTGLDNITARSQKKSDELTGSITQLQAEQRTERESVNAIQSIITKALRDQDYATAGAQQQELGAAQSKLSVTETQLKVTTNAQNAFKQLLSISLKRKAAIEANREVIIAGLGVVQLPGIEDLGILEKGTTTGGTGGTGFFNL